MEVDGIIVEMRASGARPPFWLLHPLGGNVLFGREFLSKLPSDQPLLGIQARGLDGHAAPFTSIPEAARYYLQRVRKRQPRGPYFLGGPSFGGNLAYEMARELLAGGERVGMVALFDAYAPGYPRRTSLWQRAQARLHRLRHGNPRREDEHDDVYAQAGIPDGDSETLLTLRRVSRAHNHALRTYRAAPYAGRLDLFRATTPPDWQGLTFDDETNGWGTLARDGVQVTAVPGTHQFILDPPWVDSLIVEFARLLRGAQEPHAGSSVPATQPWPGDR